MIKMSDCLEAAKKFESLKNDLEKTISTLKPLDLVTPENLTEEKQRWIEKASHGFFINPDFSYNQKLLYAVFDKKDEVAKLKERITIYQPIKESEAFYLRHLLHIANDAIDTVEMAKSILSHDDKTLSYNVLSKYGRPYADIMRYANVIAADKTKRRSVKNSVNSISEEELSILKDAVLESTFVRDIFQWVANHYEVMGAKNTKISVANDISRIQQKVSLIEIPIYRKINGIKLGAIVGSEVEARWRCNQNAKRIGFLSSSSEMLYDGLARLKEYNFYQKIGLDAELPKPYYIIAMNKAMEGYSFAETANILMDVGKLPINQLWQYTYSVFRGISDAKNNSQYAFTKDRSHLEGMIYARRLAAQNKLLLGLSSLSEVEILSFRDNFNPEEIRDYIIPDLNLQEVTIKEILKRI